MEHRIMTAINELTEQFIQQGICLRDWSAVRFARIGSRCVSVQRTSPRRSERGSLRDARGRVIGWRHQPAGAINQLIF
jgi:hypothetical protein